MTSIQVSETNNKIDQIHVQRFCHLCHFIEPTGATIASQGTNISLYPKLGKGSPEGIAMSFPCEPPIGFNHNGQSTYSHVRYLYDNLKALLRLYFSWGLPYMGGPG